MKSLFDPGLVKEIKGRVATLRPDSAKQWGVMNAAQAMAHCSLGLETALGDLLLPRMMIGRVIGWMVKTKVVGDDEPLRRNSPTGKELVVSEARDLAQEQARLNRLLDRFAVGPQCCTTHPHTFFGPLTPEEWGILMYKHLDHHLRQFGV